MEHVEFNGWDCIRLTNGKVELLITRDVGPRIIRYGFVGGPNVMAEIEADKYSKGGDVWVNRGGHRLWIAPEAYPFSYELDNEPYAEAIEIEGGIRTRQNPGSLTNVQKEMDIVLDENTGFVRICNRLRNCGSEPIELACWSLNVCGKNSREIIPLPEKKPHCNDNLPPNQNWSLWSYTDLSDSRWTIGKKYLFLRQDPSDPSPQKIGMRNRFGWIALECEKQLFVMKFDHSDSVAYPDGNCNFETFTNGDFVELEALGPLVKLAPGETTELNEEWKLFGDFEPCSDENDVTARVLPLI